MASKQNLIYPQMLMNLFYRITAFFLRKFFRIFYHFSVQGLYSPFLGKAILASNHVSFLDPPLIAIAWPEEVHFLAKATLFRYKMSQWLLKRLNTHPIQGSSQDLESFRLVCHLLDKGKKVVIFPEGERSANGELKMLKPGIAMLALRMNCPIIPLYIKGSFEAWPKQSHWPKFRIHLCCRFGAPIFPHFPLNMTKKQQQAWIMQKVQLKLQELQVASLVSN